MRPATPSAARIEFMGVLLLFSICGYFLAPFSYGDRHLLAPQIGGMDAIQESLLVSSGMDKLLNDPQSYYDTAILYPDRNQLRSTEPFLGFAVLGLPLRTILHLNDSDVFEALRWAIVITCLTYAYLLFRAIGLDVAMSVAGAVVCLSQPDLLNNIGRLQVVSMPLIFAVLYHGVMVWTTRRLRHSVGLFVFAALYPLCGMINATLSALAVLLILPLLLKMLAAEQRQKRLAACLVPILLAAVLDGLVMAPWLLSRSDMAVYVSDAFLQIKHWGVMRAPRRVQDIPGFVTGRIGPGVAAALVMLCVSILTRHIDRAAKNGVRQPELAPPAQTYLSAVCVFALGLSISTSYQSSRLILPWLQLVFQIVCYVTLLLYWRAQIRLFISNDQNGIRNYVLMLSAGLGVCLCLMSFGPVYVSNNSPLANHIMNVLLQVLPSLKAIREFSRIWILGVLFLSVYVTVRLGVALRLSAPITRVGAAAVLVVAAMSSVYNRQVVAAVNTEAPRDFFQLASHSRSTGGMYVHPYMQWNTIWGMWMIPFAKELGRPIVNGYLGIEPPWFSYAGSVLHGFPDPESVWLLRKWKVDTVVSLVGNVRSEESPFVDKVFENGNGVVYEIAAPPEDLPHPSGDECVASEGHVRIEGELSQAEGVVSGASLTVTVPKGFWARRVEISFGQSVVDRIPESIGVYALDGARRVRLNQDHSGEWIESLAADALLRRRLPVATIRLNGPERREFQVEFRKSEKPPIERIVLCGEWTEHTEGTGRVYELRRTPVDTLLRERHADFAAAIAAGDAAKGASFYARDAVLVPPGERIVKGHGAIAEWLARTLDPSPTSLLPDVSDVVVSGDEAYIGGGFTLSGKMAGGRRAVRKGTYVEIWKMTDGQWKLAYDILRAESETAATR